MAADGARGSEPESPTIALLRNAKQTARGIGISRNTARAEFSRAAVSPDASIACGTVFLCSRLNDCRGPRGEKTRLLMLAFQPMPLMRNFRLESKQGLRHSQ